MNETIARYWEQINQRWNQFNKTQKWMIIGSAILTLITLLLLIYHFSKTEYSIAYTNLDPADAAAIKEYLENRGIPYRFSNDGKSIGVPTRMLTEVKIDVEAQNLIQNGSFGYGIFRENISSFGMTESQFEVLNVDAKAGEIQKLLNAIDGVVRSNVLLTLPEKSVFLRDDMNDEAYASVVVHLDPTKRIDQRKIDTMYNLVHKSVANLPMENITISDQNGELLPSSRLNEGAGGTESIIAQQFEIKKRYETDIQKNIQNFLSRILGPDKVVVSVVASLNFDQENREERLFTPVNEIDQQGIERSVQEIQRSYTSDSGADPGGIPGMGNQDVPGYPAAEPGGSASSEELERIVNYEVNEITRSIVSSPYVVQDLTIFAGIEPPDPNDPLSLSQETRDEIHRMLVNIVSASLADSHRSFTPEELNSKVTVITQTFQTPSSEEAGLTLAQSLLYGLAGAAALALAGGGIVYWIRRRRQEDELDEELQTLDDVEEEVPTVDFEVGENYIRKQLETLAHRQPEEFVNLLRTWLVEE